jgi:hypothetical protein
MLPIPVPRHSPRDYNHAMTSPGQFGPPPPHPGGGSGRLVLMIVLSVLGILGLCCGVACSGVFVLWSRSPNLARRVEAAIEEKISPQPAWVNDWMIQERLSRAYTIALDAVADNKEVNERLGDPIEPAGDPDELFRRENNGAPLPEETIEFDIKGPKATAVVIVVTGQVNGPRFSQPGSGAKKITVKFADGSQLDVPPPKEDVEVQP